jgi:hypothetical protein
MKKVLIVLFVLVLICCCVSIAGGVFLTDQASRSIAETERVRAEKKALSQPVKLKPGTKELFASDDSAKSNFKIGDSIRVRNAYTIKVTQHERKYQDISITGYSDPFKGDYISIYVEIENFSDKEIRTPFTALFDSQTGIADEIGSVYNIDLVDYNPYTIVAPGKKYSGYVQYKLGQEKDIPLTDKGIRIEDTNIDLDVYSPLDSLGEINFDIKFS